MEDRGKKRWWTHVEEESADGGKQKKEVVTLNFQKNKKKTLLRPVSSH